MSGVISAVRAAGDSLDDERRDVRVYISGMNAAQAWVAFAETASQANDSARVGAAWRVALERLTGFADSVDNWRPLLWSRSLGSPTRQDPSRHVLPVYDGDRPKDRVNGADMGTSYPGGVQKIDALAKVLWWREDVIDTDATRVKSSPSRNVRHTHRRVHEALADGPTSGGHLSKGCKWCQEGGR